MNNVDVSIRLRELTNEIKSLNLQLNELKKGIGMNELWDNADIIRNWKISERTLATWRQEGLIGFVKVGGKIWYPVDERKLFLNSNLIEGGTISDGEKV